MTDWSTLAYFFWECPLCRAAVSRGSREKHEEWHRSGPPKSDTLPPESDTPFWGAVTLGLWFKERRERLRRDASQPAPHSSGGVS